MRAISSNPCCWTRALRTSIEVARGHGRAGVSGRRSTHLGVTQSAAACCWPQTGGLECLAAFPAEPPLAERGVRDGVAGLYLERRRRGELLTLGGRTVPVPVPDVLTEALNRSGRPAVVAHRWREAELPDALEAAAIPLADLLVRRQGYRDGAEDVRAFWRACAEGRVTVAPSLLLRSALGEARTVTDPAGTPSCPSTPRAAVAGGPRDDSPVAAILAVAEGVRRDAAPRGHAPGATRSLDKGVVELLPMRWRYRHEPNT